MLLGPFHGLCCWYIGKTDNPITMPRQYSVKTDTPQIITCWTDYTPTFDATGTTPTIGSGGQIIGKWRRVGDTMSVNINVQWGTSPSLGDGNYTVTLPPADMGLTIDTSKTVGPANGQISDGAYVGQGYAYRAVPFTSRRNLAAYYRDDGGTNYDQVVVGYYDSGSMISEDTPFVWLVDDFIAYQLELPILEWA